MMPTAASFLAVIWPRISISANSRLAISTWISSTASRETREKRGVAPEADRAGLVVAEAQVGGQAAAPDRRLDGAVEDVHEAAGVFAVGRSSSSRARPR
jgi:hypothetical protein